MNIVMPDEAVTLERTFSYNLQLNSWAMSFQVWRRLRRSGTGQTKRFIVLFFYLFKIFKFHFSSLAETLHIEKAVWMRPST